MNMNKKNKNLMKFLYLRPKLYYQKIVLLKNVAINNCSIVKFLVELEYNNDKLI